MNMHKPERVATPTRDTSVARRDLDELGYCLIDTALPQGAIERLRERLLAQAEAERQRGLAFRDAGPQQRFTDADGRIIGAAAFSAENGGVNQRVWMLANKGAAFRELLVHKLVDSLVGHVLGSEFIVSNFSANIARPGGTRMGLHTDQWWMPQPIAPGRPHTLPADLTRKPSPQRITPDPALGIAPAVVCNTMWMLSDFTAENGATELVPGSHLSGAQPDPELDQRSSYPVVQPEAPAGTLLVFDGRLWHGTGANTGGPDRLGLLATFCAPQFRQQENQPLGLDPELHEQLSDKLRARLGFRIWNAYGRIESPAAGWVSPQPERIGELNPS